METIIKIEAENEDDLAVAIEEILRLVKLGYLHGQDKDFNFKTNKQLISDAREA